MQESANEWNRLFKITQANHNENSLNTIIHYYYQSAGSVKSLFRSFSLSFPADFRQETPIDQISTPVILFQKYHTSPQLRKPIDKDKLYTEVCSFDHLWAIVALCKHHHLEWAWKLISSAHQSKLIHVDSGLLDLAARGVREDGWFGSLCKQQLFT